MLQTDLASWPGPAKGTWQGKIQEPPEADALLAGTPCLWVGAWWGRSWTLRVAELEEDGLLVADGDRLSVWVPSEQPDGRGPICERNWSLQSAST